MAKKCPMCGKPMRKEVSPDGLQTTYYCPKHGHVAGEIRAPPRYDFKVWLFFYLLFVVPYSLAAHWLNILGPYQQNPTYWLICLFYAIVTMGIFLLWYRVSENLAYLFKQAFRR